MCMVGYLNLKAPAWQGDQPQGGFTLGPCFAGRPTYKVVVTLAPAWQGDQPIRWLLSLKTMSYC